MSIGVFKTLNLFILFIEQVARTHKHGGDSTGGNIAGAFEAIGATVADGLMEAKYGRGHAGALLLVFTVVCSGWAARNPIQGTDAISASGGSASG
jgi:hypothetical protein